MAKTSHHPLPEFQLTTVTTSPFEPRRCSKTFEDHEPLRRVRDHLKNNLSARLPLAKAAEVAGFESTYFSTYFHRKVGITYLRWMNALRVAHAIELLRTSDVEIFSVGRAVGYSDLRTFERNFSRLTGQSPIEFRRQARSRLERLQSLEAETSSARGREGGKKTGAHHCWLDPDLWNIPS